MAGLLPLTVHKELPSAQFGCFWTNGQICSATSRLLVHESIADKFYARLKQRAESIKIGNPLEEDCRLGPVVAKSQLDKITAFIQVSDRKLWLLDNDDACNIDSHARFIIALLLRSLADEVPGACSVEDTSRS